MKILLLAGSGAIGRHVAVLAASRGHEVFVTSRVSRGLGQGVQLLQGDAMDRSFLCSVLKRKWDVVIDFLVYSTQDFSERIDELLGSANHYIFLSSARVYADSEYPITEQSPRLIDVCDDADYLRTAEYALEKARQEDLLRSATHNNWTIVRPYVTYAENRLQLGVFEKEAWLFRALRNKPIVFSEDICRKKTSLTYARDVAHWIVGLCGLECARRETFNVMSNENITWGSVLAFYQECLREAIGFNRAPVLVGLEEFQRIHRNWAQVCFDRLYDRTFDNTKIQQVVGRLSTVPPVSGLRMCLKRFLADPEFRAIDYILEGTKDRIANVKSDLSGFPDVKSRVRYLYGRYFR